MAHYYIDFKNPPPFRELLPNGVGYISRGGLIVLYGIKSIGDVQRQNHWPAVENIAPKVLEKLRRVPKHEVEGDLRHAARNRPQFQWPALDEIPKEQSAREPYRPLPKFNAKFATQEPHKCEACELWTYESNRHHPIPVSVRYNSKTIRLCFDCHTVIHSLSNETLAVTSVEDQISYILRRRYPPPSP